MYHLTINHLSRIITTKIKIQVFKFKCTYTVLEKIWYVHTMTYYTTIKRNKSELYMLLTWRNFHEVFLSEKSRGQRREVKSRGGKINFVGCDFSCGCKWLWLGRSRKNCLCSYKRNFINHWAQICIMVW